MDNNRRKSIRRQIRKATTWDKPKQPRNEQAIIIAGLNVLQVLGDKAPPYLHDVLHYGPDSFAGDGWAATVIWYRRKGYHSYKELMLFGIWAVAEDETTALRLGTKTLAYSAPVYNAESYQQVIRSGFKTYYGDDGSPPPQDSIVFATAYDITRRIALRRELETAIINHLRTHPPT